MTQTRKHKPSASALSKAMPIGVLDLRTLTASFRQAAWMIVLERSTTVVESSAFDHTDWRTHFMWGLTHAVGGPVATKALDSRFKLASVESDYRRAKFEAEGKSIVLLNEFLRILASGKPGAAKGYANSVYKRQKDAADKLNATYRRADKQNAQVSRDAHQTAVVLSNVLMYSEIALAAGVCVLTLGAAPVVLAGSAAAQIAAAGTISTVYGVASMVVSPDLQDAVQGYAINAQIGDALKGRQQTQEIRAAAAQQAALHKTETFRQAQARVRFYNDRLAQNLGSADRAKAVAGWARANAATNTAARELAKIEQIAHNARMVGRAMPVIGMTWEMFSAVKAHRDRMEKMGN